MWTIFRLLTALQKRVGIGYAPCVLGAILETPRINCQKNRQNNFDRPVIETEADDCKGEISKALVARSGYARVYS